MLLINNTTEQRRQATSRRHRTRAADPQQRKQTGFANTELDPADVRYMMPRSRVSNVTVQKWIARRHGFVALTATIDHCKNLCGISTSDVPASAVFCSGNERDIIEEAFRALGLL
jgi:hypothetical protein